MALRAMPAFAALAKLQNIAKAPGQGARCQGPSTALAAGKTDPEVSSLLQEPGSSESLGTSPSGGPSMFTYNRKQMQLETNAT